MVRLSLLTINGMSSAVEAHFRSHPVPNWLLTVGGAVAIVAGIWLLIDAATAATLFLALLGVYWLVTGAVAIIHAVMQRDSTWGWRLAGGIGRVLAGLLIIGQPQFAALLTVVTLYFVLVVAAVVTGLCEIVDGLVRRQRDWLEVAIGCLQVFIGVMLFVYTISGGLRLFVPIIGLSVIAAGVLLLGSGIQAQRAGAAAQPQHA